MNDQSTKHPFQEASEHHGWHEVMLPQWDIRLFFCFFFSTFIWHLSACSDGQSKFRKFPQTLTLVSISDSQKFAFWKVRQSYLRRKFLKAALISIFFFYINTDLNGCMKGLFLTNLWHHFGLFKLIVLVFMRHLLYGSISLSLLTLFSNINRQLFSEKSS